MEKVRIKDYVKRIQRNYGLAFTSEFLDSEEKVELRYKQAQLRDVIQGVNTVLVWLRKHGRLDWKIPKT